MNRNVLLTTARDTINGERETEYGGPEDSFTIIAAFWDAFLKHRREEGDLRPYEVALMVDLLKTARLLNSKGQHVDSWVDKAGYAACGAECAVDDPMVMPVAPKPPPIPAPRLPPRTPMPFDPPGWKSKLNEEQRAELETELEAQRKRTGAI